VIKIIGSRVIATEDEISACPQNVRWASKMLQLFGPQLALESRKLKPFLTCPEVAKEAGIELKKVKTLEEFKEEVKKAEAEVGKEKTREE
jgi:hypothetical protein